MFEVAARSPILDGSIPVRAAQGCKPLLDGNSAGLHVRAKGPAMISRGEDGVVLRLTDEDHTAANEGFDERLERLVERGLIVRDGYWHRELAKGFCVREGDTLRVWTGLLVKPEPGVWIALTTAYNRRCLVDVAESVLCDDAAYTPLVLEFDVKSLREDETWLDTEIATLTALRPGARLSIKTLTEAPELGRSFLDFYTKDYLERRGEAQYAGRYRKVTALATKQGEDAAEWTVAYGGGCRELVEVARFQRFLTAAGPAESDPSGRDLEFAAVRATFDVAGRWDGSNLRDLTEPPADALERLSVEWTSLYGEGSMETVEWWASYVLPLLGPHRAEPFMSTTPWVLAVTPQGWSSMAEGMPFANLDPMRGVIGTDTFPAVPLAFQFQNLGAFRIPTGVVAGRIVPIPRDLLLPGVRIAPAEV